MHSELVDDTCKGCVWVVLQALISVPGQGEKRNVIKRDHACMTGGCVPGVCLW